MCVCIDLDFFFVYVIRDDLVKEKKNKMKRTRPVTIRKESTQLEPNEGFDTLLPMDAINYILLFLYDILMDQYDNGASALQRIIIHCVSILPNLEYRLFIAQFIPLVRFVEPSVWLRAQDLVIPKFRNIRKLIVGNAHNTGDGKRFSSLYNVEELIIRDGLAFNLEYAKEWKNLHTLEIEDGRPLLEDDSVVSVVLGRIRKLVLVTRNQEAGLFGRLSTIEILKQKMCLYCANLHTLRLSILWGVAVPENITNLVTLTTLDLRKYNIRDDQLALLTRLQCLYIDGDNTLTSTGLRSVAQTLTELDINTYNARSAITDVSMLTNLQSLGIAGIAIEHGFDMFTGMRRLNLSTHISHEKYKHINLPPLLESLKLADTRYTIGNDDLRKLTRLKELSINGKRVIEPDPVFYGESRFFLCGVTNLTSLQIGDIGGHCFEDSDLSHLTKLEVLTLRDQPFITPDLIIGLSCLRVVSLYKCGCIINVDKYMKNHKHRHILWPRLFTYYKEEKMAVIEKPFL